MSVTYYLGVIAGALSGLALVALLAWIIRKFGGKVSMFKGKKCMDYDERQLVVRNKAFKYAFFTLIAYVTIVQLMNEISGISLLCSLGGTWIGITFSIAIFVVYCVWNDAYISMQENKKGILLLFGGIGLINLIITIVGVMRNQIEFLETVQIMRDGVLTDNVIISFQSMNLICVVLCIVICAAIIIKSLFEEKEDEE